METGKLCPSAQPDQPGAQIIGVAEPREGGARIRLLAAPVPPASVAHLIPAGIPVPEILRLAAPCAEQSCRHFQNERCALGARVATRLAPLTDRLVRCAIRPRCRWWAEQGAAACRRCPHIVTEPFQASDLLREIAGPGAAPPISP